MVLGKRTLAGLEKQLLEERRITLSKLNEGSDVKEIREADKSPSDEADQARDLISQTLTWSMRKRLEQKLREVDAALIRLKNGTYGICEESGEPIELKRLQAQPWTRVSLEAARELERERRQAAALGLSPPSAEL